MELGALLTGAVKSTLADRTPPPVKRTHNSTDQDAQPEVSLPRTTLNLVTSNHLLLEQKSVHVVEIFEGPAEPQLEALGSPRTGWMVTERWRRRWLGPPTPGSLPSIAFGLGLERRSFPRVVVMKGCVRLLGPRMM